MAGSINENFIEVYAYNTALNLEDQYVFFLNKQHSSGLPLDFYVQHPEFIKKIENDQLLRLKNSESQEYIPPFVKEEYNNLSFLENHVLNNKPRIANNK